MTGGLTKAQQAVLQKLLTATKIPNGDSAALLLTATRGLVQALACIDAVMTKEKSTALLELRRDTLEAIRRVLINI